MNQTSVEPPAVSAVELPDDLSTAVDISIKSEVWSVLAGMYPFGSLRERRYQDRFPYPRLVQLTPCTQDGALQGEAMVASGKHLSERGLGFYHNAPLPHRFVIASLQKAESEWMNLVLDLTWCRFICPGWYESGGRFIRTATLPDGSQQLL